MIGINLTVLELVSGETHQIEYNHCTQRHGLKVYLRDPNSFTPILGTDKYLLLGNNQDANKREIAKFSRKDAEVYIYIIYVCNFRIILHIGCSRLAIVNVL